MKQPDLEHVQLCDLLIGRSLRLQAQAQFEYALATTTATAEMQQLADLRLDAAAHTEWIAGIAERGVVRWGGRFNRCGYQAAENRHHWQRML